MKNSRLEIFCLLSALYCLLSGGCLIQSVERSVELFSPEEVKECIARLGEQNFEFEIRLEKPGVNGNFKGIVSKGDARIEGVWEFDGKREQVNVIGIGEKEYKWENGKWNEGSRTNISNPVATLELVCSIGQWEFKKLEGKSFIYKFKPNLFFMDPGLIKSEGLIWINTESRFPEKAVAEGENIKWEFLVKNIGMESHILNPLAKEQRIKVSVEAPSFEELQRVAQILKKRFEIHRFNQVAYKLKRNKIVLSFLTQPASESLIEPLLEPGELELYKAGYAHSSEESSYFVRGDPTNPVILKEKLKQELVCADFEAGFIELTFDKKLPEGEAIAVVVDNEVIEFIPEVWGKRIKIEGDKETWIKIKFPLPCKLTLLKGGKDVR